MVYGIELYISNFSFFLFLVLFCFSVFSSVCFLSVCCFPLRVGRMPSGGAGRQAPSRRKPRLQAILDQGGPRSAQVRVCFQARPQLLQQLTVFSTENGSDRLRQTARNVGANGTMIQQPILTAAGTFIIILKY